MAHFYVESSHLNTHPISSIEAVSRAPDHPIEILLKEMRSTSLELHPTSHLGLLLRAYSV